MIHLDVSSIVDMQQYIQLVALPSAKRKRVLAKLAREVRKNSRQRLRQQKDLDGRKWQSRKSGSRKKMLRKFSKHLSIKTNDKSTKIGFRNAVIGRIANAQQKGLSENMNAAKMKARHGEVDYQAPATRQQAKALRSEGYKIRRNNGKGWKTATLTWITQNLTVGKAGLILKILRDDESKSSWTIALPQRSFLGVSNADKDALIQTLLNETINAGA